MPFVHRGSTKSAPNTYGFGNSLTAPISAGGERPAQRKSTHASPAMLPPSVQDFGLYSLSYCAYRTLRREVLCGSLQQIGRSSIFPRALPPAHPAGEADANLCNNVGRPENSRRTLAPATVDGAVGLIPRKWGVWGTARMRDVPAAPHSGARNKSRPSAATQRTFGHFSCAGKVPRAASAEYSSPRRLTAKRDCQ